MRHRLGEKESLARKRKYEEKKMLEEFKELEIEMHKLTGEKNQIEGTHKALKEEFQQRQANKKGPSEHDAINELIKVDPGKYTTLMTDLAMGAPSAGPAPIWATLPFLERPEDGINPDPKKALKNEIDRLR